MEKRQVRTILIGQWDPLRMVKRRGRITEYDLYIPGITKLVAAGAGAKALEGYLNQIISVQIGLNRSKSFSRRAARSIAKLWRPAR